MRRAVLPLFAVLLLALPGSGQEKKEPAFDTKDPRKALAWFSERAKSIYQSYQDENILAVVAKRKKIEEFGESMKGTAIVWPMTIYSVGKSGVVLAWVRDERGPKTPPNISLAVRPYRKNDDSADTNLPVPAGDWILEAKKGDPVILKARIARLNCGVLDMASSFSLQVSITDVIIEKGN